MQSAKSQKRTEKRWREMDRMDKEERPSQLINLLLCKGQGSTLFARLSFLIYRIIVELEERETERFVWGSVHLFVCASESEVYFLCVRLCEHLPLSGFTVLSLSVWSRHRTPLPTHNPFLPRCFTLPPLAPMLRWSYHTMHTNLACPSLCVCVCVFTYGGVYFPKTSPSHYFLFLCKSSAIRHACLLHNKAKLLQTLFYSWKLIGNESPLICSLCFTHTSFLGEDTNTYCTQLMDARCFLP